VAGIGIDGIGIDRIIKSVGSLWPIRDVFMLGPEMTSWACTTGESTRQDAKISVRRVRPERGSDVGQLAAAGLELWKISDLEVMRNLLIDR